MWFLDWVWDEMSTGGVPVDLEEEEVLEPNCCVPGVHIRWDWNGDEMYEAKVLTGPFKGKVVKSSVNTMTQEKWDVVSRIHGYAVDYEHATRDHKKDATWHFLEQDMLKVLASRPVAE